MSLFHKCWTSQRTHLPEEFNNEVIYTKSTLFVANNAKTLKDMQIVKVRPFMLKKTTLMN
jgi:hypothetical protein